jgi:heme/copper-type cytochrome/quinol oxidase subunit 1
VSRMRPGEWVAALGALGLFVTLFLDWFSVDGEAAGWKAYAPLADEVHLSGWGSLGWFMDVLLCLAIIGGASLCYMTVKRTAPAWPVGAAVLTWIVGSLIFLVLVVRVALQPGLGLGLPNRPVLVEAPAYAGLLFALLIPVGGFLSLRDERTDTAEARAFTPPPARPAPGT